MKYILSYASNPAGSPGQNPVYSRKLLETSIRNLLQELVEVGCGTPAAILPPRKAHPFLGIAGEAPRFAGQNIVMKKGDWICPMCSFMNFARNLKCLECEEPRPRRQLTGGEWECPKCDFLNYGRNVACLRCDSKRPAVASFNTVNNSSSGNAHYRTVNRDRFSSSEENAQKWFIKANDASGINDTSADGDIFPEMIMPLRKEENKSVVSATRKTLLERRLANSQHKGNSVNSILPEEEEEDKERAEKSGNNWFKKMEELHDDFPETVQTNDDSLTTPMNKRETDKDFVPFVPFPPGFFATKETHDKLENDIGGSSHTDNDHASHAKQNPRRSVWTGKSLEGCGVKEEANDPLDMSEEAKTERWFRRVAQIKDISELSQIPDEDFPSIMPMRKGVNRFVVSKRKTPLERRLMSSQYKRNLPAVRSTGDFVEKEDDVNETE
ncbi:unnamed protein product [Cuscuta campestris]|uniref:RanBP2-type domain-containing protein n=1 Tax=Cuscuta campestris TaxID=132261 RepID=A0A484MSN6_9ASTE|nr:unnamed protein product [Cuscuta campestris]